MPTPECDFHLVVQEALACLKSGGVVAFPTDTLYGLGADVFNEAALQRVFDIKGRPQDLALPVLVAGWDQVEMVAAEVPVLGQRLAEKFWPGPLTLVVPRSCRLPRLVTAGRDTVAVRMPDHRIPLALAAGLGGPITGTSANRSGGADLLRLQDVRDQLGRLVDCVVGCGPVPRGHPSTIVDITGGAPRLLREGALPFERVLAAVP